MSFISKSGFVSACVRCNKYAWLEQYMPGQKTPVDEFTQSLFDNGHKVGELAKQLEEGILFVSDVECKWMCLNCGFVFMRCSAYRQGFPFRFL